MSRIRLFHTALSSGSHVLSPEESHHFSSVLRGRCAQELTLFDGEGREGTATVTEVSRKGVVVDIEAIVERPFARRIQLTLATAMPRKQRQAFLLEKCTELGVWAIWPTICARSVALPKKEHDERWRRTTIEAAKQCGRSWLPRIEGPLTFAETVQRAASFDLCVVTDVGTRAASLVNILPADHGANPVRLLAWIGPEGGLTQPEIDAATEVGAMSARLGANTLRVETAALAVAATVEQLQ